MFWPGVVKPHPGSWAGQRMCLHKRLYACEPRLPRCMLAGPGLPRTAAAGAQPPAAPAGVSGLDDLLGLGGPSLAPATPPSPAFPPQLQLDPRPALTPAAFQQQWGALPAALRLQQPLSPGAVAAIEANGHQVRWLHGAVGST